MAGFNLIYCYAPNYVGLEVSGGTATANNDAWAGNPPKPAIDYSGLATVTSYCSEGPFTCP